jgi:DNA polymerase III epsilon subunit-like protein
MSWNAIPGDLLRSAKPDLVFVDLETSGTNHRFHEILEIAAIRFNPDTWAERSRFVAKVRPTMPVDPEAAAVNGYTLEGWKDAISLDEGLRGLFPIVDGARWVGSKPSFDYEFVETNARACGREMPALATHRLVDVSAMAEPLIVAGAIKGGGMARLCEFFDIRMQLHRAENDALATMQVYRSLLRLFLPALRRAA